MLAARVACLSKGVVDDENSCCFESIADCRANEISIAIYALATDGMIFKLAGLFFVFIVYGT